MPRKTIRERNENLFANPAIGAKRGDRYHYFTANLYTFWDDDPFGYEECADTLSELQAIIARTRKACERRAMNADGYLPMEQAFSHSPITRVNVTVI